MKGIFIFAAATLWGSLSAQFLVQVFTSLAVAVVYLTGAIFGKVSKGMNCTGALVSFVQSIVFGILFGGGNWLTSEYVIDYLTWDAAPIASLVAFVATIIYVALQVPGKILLAKMSAWVPNFMEASMRVPRAQRVAFARKWRQESEHADRPVEGFAMTQLIAAAQSNNAEAQYDLAVAYMNGAEVPQNFVEAYFWLTVCSGCKGVFWSPSPDELAADAVLHIHDEAVLGDTLTRAVLWLGENGPPVAGDYFK